AQKGAQVLDQLNTLQPSAPHRFLTADLSSQRSIRELSAKIYSYSKQLDVLINNAGVFTTQLRFTEDGIELQFAVNHLAPFLLSHLLMDALRHSPDGRIINLSSLSHRFGTINIDDLYRTRHYDGLRVYEQSKLANLLFTYELARRIKPTGITVNAANPGRVRTDIGITHATGIYRLLWKWNKPLLIAPEKGAATSVYLASSPAVRGVTGAYFYKMKPCQSSKRSYDVSLAQLVWERSALLTGI
ncbi:MAG: hypothetical protein RL732_987, partial [Bacteroidota bacterium]